MIALDTDILCIYHIFKQDARFEPTAALMSAMEQIRYGVPIFSLLELCGVTATAGYRQEALTLFEEYVSADNITLLYPPVDLASPQQFWARQNTALLQRIERGVRLGDAAILWTVESTACEALITWNVRHYREHTDLEVRTPDEWLHEHRLSPTTTDLSSEDSPCLIC